MQVLKNILNKVTHKFVISGLLLGMSLYLIISLLLLGVLPVLYASIVIIIILCINVSLFFMMKTDNEKSVRVVVSKVICVVLSIIMLIGGIYLNKGNKTLESITSADKDTYTYSLIVLKDSHLDSIKDMKNKKIVMNVKEDIQYFTKALTSLKENNKDFQSEEINDFHQSANYLYQKKCDGIFINEAYRTIIEENYPHFTEETKVIWSCSIDKKIEDFSKNVDVTNKPFVIYISGIDTFGNVSTVSRSDVNMIVTINPVTKQILMTSIPRDYYVTLANKCKKDKLTHSGLAGIENTVKTVENFMDIDINYYARVNFTSLIRMVDALGGIEVKSIENFTIGQYHYVKGINQLNGDQALYFARARYTVTGGDNGRVANQQRVLTGMLKKMMSPVILTNYTSVLDSIEGCFETNMSADEITSLIQMQLSDMSSWNIVHKQMSGHGQKLTGGAYMPQSKLYYMIPNERSVQENKLYIQKVLKGEKITNKE